MIRIRRKLIAVLVLCATAAPAYGNDIRYSITDLGVLGNGPSSYPTAMNDLGQVVGYADTYTHYSHAFLSSSSGSLINLGSFGGDYSISYATAINNYGMIVGYSDSSGVVINERGFLYSGNGPMQDLGTLGGADTEALDINNLGQVVGVSQTPDGSYHGFLYSRNGPMVDLAPMRAAELINDAAEIVATTGTAPCLHTYISSGGTTAWVDIGSLGGADTQPISMNNRGDIVGESTISTSAAYPRHAFLYSGGSMTDLGTFGGQLSYASGINDLGVVVGSADLPGDLTGHGFVYYGSGVLEDLNGLVPDLPPGWTIIDAMAVNNCGQIAADVSEQNGDYHAVLLTPTPEPSSVCLLITAAFAVLTIKAGGFTNQLRGFG